MMVIERSTAAGRAPSISVWPGSWEAEPWLIVKCIPAACAHDLGFDTGVTGLEERLCVLICCRRTWGPKGDAHPRIGRDFRSMWSSSSTPGLTYVVVREG